KFELQVVLKIDKETRGLELGATFDPALVQVDKVAEGSFYKDWAKASGATSSVGQNFKTDNNKGTISVGSLLLLGGPNNRGPSGEGPVLVLSMTAKPGTKGNAPIKIIQPGVVSAAGEHEARFQGVTTVEGSVAVGGDAAAKPAAAPPTAAAPAPAATPAVPA